MTTPPLPARRTRAVLLTAVAAVLLTLLPAGGAVAAGRPDLVVSSARLDRSSVAQGGALTVVHAVRNRGTAAAGASHTRFYLTGTPAASLAARRASTSNPRSSAVDALLAGARPVAGLRAGRASRAAGTRVTVPVGVAPGRYTVLVCADDRGRVSERTETDNCRSAGALRVTAAPGSGGLRLEQFADTAYWPEDEDFTLQWLKLFCGSTVPARRLTPAAAVASVEKYLTSKAGPKALTRLAAPGLADTALAAQHLAASAMSAGSPGLALAALARARRLEPGNATHWVNLAAVAVAVGLPNEALGLLDGAAAGTPRRAALGLAPQAVALTVRGQALTLQGKLGQARSALGAARAAEPLLSEADAGLAVVEACSGRDALAIRYARASRQRTDEPRKPAETPGTPEPPRPEPALDLTRGKITHLRELVVAETPALGVTMNPTYDAIADALLAEITAENTERDGIEERLRAVDSVSTLAEQQRRDGITTFAYQATETPAADALEQEVGERLDALTEHRERFFGGGTGEEESTYGRFAREANAACQGEPDYGACYDAHISAQCRPALSTAHNQWEQLTSELQSAADAWMVEVSTRMSAYAANLADPDAHRRILLQIEALERGQYALLVQQAQFWTNLETVYADHCVVPQEAPAPEPAADVEAASDGACGPLLAKMSAVARFGPTKIKVECEKVTQELSSQVLPLLEAYSSVQLDIRKGQVTFFAGAKGSAKLGVVEGAFKSGLYLTVNANGDVDDFGWRVGPSTKAGSGPLEFSAWKDEIDISFLSKDETQ